MPSIEDYTAQSVLRRDTQSSTQRTSTGGCCYLVELGVEDAVCHELALLALVGRHDGA